MHGEDALTALANDAFRVVERCQESQERGLMATEETFMRAVVQAEVENERHQEEVERFLMTFEDSLSSHAAEASDIREKTAESAERHLMTVEDRSCRTSTKPRLLESRRRNRPSDYR